MKRKHLLQLLILIPLALIIALVFVFFSVLSSVSPIRPPHEFYEQETRALQQAYQAYTAKHGHPTAKTGLQDLEKDIADWQDWYMPAESPANTGYGLSCGGGKITCVGLVQGGIIAYNRNQIFGAVDGKHYLNISIIPYKKGYPPASILLFDDGKILSGSHHKQGIQGPEGIDFITNDPPYVRENEPWWSSFKL